MQNCNCESTDRRAVPCGIRARLRISFVRGRLCGKRVRDSRGGMLESQRLRAEAEDQNRGKQKVAWEPVRATIGRVYIRRGYSDSKEVSFYPYLEPAYRPASLSSISYLSPAFSTLASFRWHVIEPAMASNRSRAKIGFSLSLSFEYSWKKISLPFSDYFQTIYI